MASLDAVCPCAGQLFPPARRALGLGLASVAAIVLTTAANALLGIGGPGLERTLGNWAPTTAYLVVALLVALRAWRVSDARGAWALFALALGLSGCGNVLWTVWISHRPSPAVPSICDGFWLAFCPLSCLGIRGLARADGVRPNARMWLDGIIAGTGLAALTAALVFRSELAISGGDVAEVATTLASPCGDMLLAAIVVGTIVPRSHQLTRVWRLLGAGFLTLASADGLYAVHVVQGTPSPTAVNSLIWVIGAALLSLAAWQPTREPGPAVVGARATLTLPALFALASVGLLQYDHLHHLDALAFVLVDVTLVAALLRGALGVRDMQGLAEARRQASTDALTSLPNRRALMRLSRDAVVRARSTGRTMAMMMIDLDNFKDVNDTLGHSAGDLLLSRLGARLRERLRAGDVIARLGGDEFAVVLRDCGDRAAAATVADDILRALHEVVWVGTLALRTSASIGIAMYPVDGGDEQELLSHADIAMYQAKRNRGRVEFYASDRDTHSTERLSRATDLARALEADELEVHFQPKGRVDTREIVGVEALVRWRRHGRHVSPLDFLGAAEQAGLSGALTATVLSKTLRQLAVWRESGIEIHAAVNTTVSDLLDLGFPDRVDASLARAGVPPQLLVLEVTESSVLTDPQRIGDVLAALRELGVTIALDDFGTGYSSLSHLVSLPVTELKIDRSFVSGLAPGLAPGLPRTAVVEAMVGLGHRLGMRVLAEGVEDEATWAALSRMGCDWVQGNHLGRPVAADELTPRLLAGSAQRGGDVTRAA